LTMPRPVFLFLLVLMAIPPLSAQDANWVRPRKAGDPLIWGRTDGIVFGLPSEGGMRGPRGLIRVGTMDGATGTAMLLNFIAVEPATQGKKPRADRMGFSELEKSRLDKGKFGARLWVANSGANVEPNGGTISKEYRDGHEVETLSIRIEIERFTQNRAHVYLILTMDSDHPNELRLSAFPYEDSRPLEEVVFTATMGAYERLRFLWLKDEVVDSRKLYANYTGYDFAEAEAYPAESMLRDQQGNPIALCTSSERTPSLARNSQAGPNWYYDGPRMTQYWTIPAKDEAPNLRVRVNGRYAYWKSKNVIPGGTTFENFELRQTFHPGQTFIFGVSRKEPSEWMPPLTNLPANPESE